MNWPQWVYAALIGYEIVRTIVKLARDRDLESGAVTIAILFILAWYAGVAGVLHAGGFW